MEFSKYLINILNSILNNVNSINTPNHLEINLKLLKDSCDVILNNYDDLILCENFFELINQYLECTDVDFYLLKINTLIDKNKKLNIFKKIINNGIIHLIGRTEFGMTYEIGIWPSLIYNWFKWTKKHSTMNIEVKKNSLNEILKLQKNIDSAFVLR